MKIELYLDITTLSAITALFSFLYGFGMFAFSINKEKYQGIRIYALGLCILGLGFSLMGLGYATVIESIFVTRLLAFSLILVSFVFLNYGLSKFRQVSPTHVIFGSIFFVVLLPILYFYIYISPSVITNIAWISIFISTQSALCAYDLFRGNCNDLFLAKLLTAAPFIASSIYFLFRTLWALDESELLNFLDAGVIHQLAFLVICTLILLSSFGLLWLISSRLHRDLEVQTKTDPLTSLYNRRYLETIIPRELKRASQESTTVSVIMLDIDNFKKLNDQYGHQLGDKVLTIIGKILKDNTHLSGIPCRYGGEEFLIFLPNTKQRQALNVAEKIRSIIENTVFHDELNIKTSASIGVSNLQPTDDFDSIIKRADRNLYKAKKQGRNRVVA